MRLVSSIMANIEKSFTFEAVVEWHPARHGLPLDIKNGWHLPRKNPHSTSMCFPAQELHGNLILSPVGYSGNFSKTIGMPLPAFSWRNTGMSFTEGDPRSDFLPE
jgi:hypothetical protein